MNAPPETLLERLITPARATVLRQLHEKPRTVQDIVEATGASPSAVHRMLRELERIGAVQHRFDRTGEARRPTHLYSLTHQAVRIYNTAIQVAER